MIREILIIAKDRIFLHYTYSKNRSLADQLADYLTARGFIVQDVEQVKYYRNEVRYFHTVDREGARTLRGHISAFLENLHTPKSASRLNLKNLAGNLPPGSPGAVRSLAPIAIDLTRLKTIVPSEQTGHDCL